MHVHNMYYMYIHIFIVKVFHFAKTKKNNKKQKITNEITTFIAKIILSRELIIIVLVVKVPAVYMYMYMYV